MSLLYFPPSPGLLLCEPIYAPDPGHENRLTHNAFFAIIHENWMGVVTSDNTIARMLAAYPKARTFRATISPETWTLPSLHNKGELPTEDARNREAVVKENIQRNLGRTRPPPVPIDPSAPTPCLPGIAARLGAAEIAARDAAVDALPSELADGISAMTIKLPPTYDARVHGTLNSHAHTRALSHPLPIEPIDGMSQDGEQTECYWAGNTSIGLDTPVMYALTFVFRDRAMAVFRATPGAELAYSHNTDELLCFLEDEDDVLPELLDEGSEAK
ncbi:hypothetical protein K438DRAFT_1769268 [Mycena galopus ATCC 62051]|nr:hypothetical protein K438DRAFT_1769268 [Mycena galopus ATCC 62051]